MVTLGKGKKVGGGEKPAEVKAPAKEIAVEEHVEVDEAKAKAPVVPDTLEKLDDGKIMEAMKKALTAKDVKPIFEKASLKAGAGKRMEPEHFVLALLESKKLAVTPEQRGEVLKAIKNDDGKKQSPRLLAILGHANALAQKAGEELGLGHIESAIRLFKHEPFSQLFGTLVPKDAEAGAAIEAAATANAAPKKKLPKLNGVAMLDKIGEDLTVKASEGKVTAAVGRDALIEIAKRRLTQAELNSVIFTGDKGTGKTQIVEGFALQIAEGQAPGFENTRLFNVRGADLAKEAACPGCSADKVIRDIIANVTTAAKATPKTDIILVIDEIHTLFEGNAANANFKEALLPYMSRGELRIIGMTTPDKYKEHFENHAITDRFHNVQLPEPSKEETIPMVMEKGKRFEKYFDIPMTAAAAQVATELSHLNGKFKRPRAATDMLDLAFAEMKLNLSNGPAELRVAKRELAHLVEAQKDVKGSDETSNKVRTQLYGDVQVMAGNVTALQKAWDKERGLVDRQMDTVKQIEEFLRKGDSQNPEVEKLQGNLDRLKKEIGGLKVVVKERDPLNGGWKEKTLTRLYRPVLDGLAVAAAISAGMQNAPPVPQLLAQLAPRGKKNIEEETKKRVHGQDHILKSLADYYRLRESGLSDENRPIGVHLIPGLTGTGKTEACKAHADAAFGPGMMCRVDCNTMREKHQIALQLGSPPGYVGHQEGSALIEALKKQGFRGVLLLDEIEKAHPDFLLTVMNLLDTGFLVDNKGNRHDCRGMQIVMTSNLGAEAMVQFAGDGEYTDQPAVMKAFQQAFLENRAFPPEIRGRIDTIDLANPLSRDTQEFIIDRDVKEMFDQVGRKRNMHLRLEDSARNHLIEVGFDRAKGGRGVKDELNKVLRTPLQEALATKEVDGKTVSMDGKWLNVVYGKVEGSDEPIIHVEEMSEKQKAEMLAKEEAAEAGSSSTPAAETPAPPKPKSSDLAVGGD